MRFYELSLSLEKLEKTTSRNEMMRILAELLRKVGKEEIDKVCYLLLGELLPSYRGLELKVAEKMMIQVLAAAYGRDRQEITKRYKATGDLGDVAYEFAGSERAKGNLNVTEVYERLLAVARESGKGSQGRKVKNMAELLCQLDARSAKYVARIPVGKLRLGFSDATLLDALSVMERGDKLARPQIEQAYNVTADIGAISKRIKVGGLAALKKLEPKPGIPIRPAMAERLRTVEEVIEKAGPLVGVEQKLDGFRTQIHVWEEKGERKVALFSRNLENTTSMFPEIVDGARRLLAEGVILDGEAIGYNPKTVKFAPFQETVQRKRKYDIAEFAKKIPLSVFVFDILYLDGRSLLELSFQERRRILERALSQGIYGAVRLAEHHETDDPEVIRQELKKSIAAGLEGLVVKNLALPYQAGSRGFHWIKLKATTAALEQLRGAEGKAGAQVLDTVDCVVIGAYRGRGKRAAFGVGGFLLGVRGPDDRYYSISRLGTGLSDEQFREANARIAKLKVATQPKEYLVDKELTPDIWARPSLVVEILSDEITLSSRHTAGRKEGLPAEARPRRTKGVGLARRSPDAGGRGYSLRFPRLVRFRDDKNPEDATTIGEIRALFRQQKSASVKKSR